MKMKKLCSTLLAAALVFGLLCTPALATTAGEIVDSLNQGYIWVDAEYAERVDENVVVKRLVHDWDNDTRVCTKGTEVYEDTVARLIVLPLDVTFTTGPDSDYTTIFAYSDPDNDGVYEQRLVFTERNEETGLSEFQIVPLSEPGPFVSEDDAYYANYLDWGYGADWLGVHVNTDGYRTLSTNYLVDLFGANTIISLNNGTYAYYYLLTGHERDESLGDESLGNCNLAVSPEGGFLTSAWAPEVVDEALQYGLIPSYIYQGHNSDLRGYITRGEFAAIAVRLYAVMSGEEVYYSNDNPFSDVEPDTDEYTFIMAARDLGIVQGNSLTANTFAPNAPVKRQDAALMLARVYKILGGTIPTGASTTFSDNAAIRADAMDAVAFMSAHEIINGTGNNFFKPANGTTIEQALKIAVYMLNNLEV